MQQLLEDAHILSVIGIFQHMHMSMTEITVQFVLWKIYAQLY